MIFYLRKYSLNKNEMRLWRRAAGQDFLENTKTPKKLRGFFVAPDGIEPPTQGFSVLCSTN
jgi:hypothetical protein